VEFISFCQDRHVTRITKYHMHQNPFQELLLLYDGRTDTLNRFSSCRCFKKHVHKLEKDFLEFRDFCKPRGLPLLFAVIICVYLCRVFFTPPPVEKFELLGTGTSCSDGGDIGFPRGHLQKVSRCHSGSVKDTRDSMKCSGQIDKTI
jgi:hypothetical protein